MSAQSRKQSTESINKQLKLVLKTAGTLQENIHKLAVSTAIHGYIYSDANIVANVLNALSEVNGSVRVNAISYWFKHVGGFAVNQDGKTGHFAVKLCNDTFESEIGIKFTFDKVHVATLKDERYRFWKIAPKDFKELKAVEDVSKITVGVEAQYARGLVLGTISEDDVIAHLEGMMDRIKQAKASKATKEWIAKFQAQHTPAEPVDQDDIDLIEELRIEELTS